MGTSQPGSPLQRHAAQITQDTYGPGLDADARAWIQVGIDAMHAALAHARTGHDAPACVLCGRTGARGFIEIEGNRYCASRPACLRRERATGMNGVTVMSNYRA